MPEAHTQGWVDNSPSKVIETMAGGRKLRMDVPWKERTRGVIKLARCEEIFIKYREAPREEDLFDDHGALTSSWER